MGLRLCLPVSPQFNRYLPNMSGYKGPAYPLEGGVQPGEVLGQHVVGMTKDISVNQRYNGLRYIQGKLVVVHLLCQHDAEPINMWPK